MTSMSYLSIIERYHEHREAIRDLLASMVTGVADAQLFRDPHALRRCLRCLSKHYPFVDLLYVLDLDGIQVSENLAVDDAHPAAREGRGRNRSQRPYFQLARASSGVVVSDPYLSSASGALCLTAVARLVATDGTLLGYLVLDIDLAKTVSFLMGDTMRRRFQPLFQSIFALIVLGLFGAAGVLLFAAYNDLRLLWQAGGGAQGMHGKPFGMIIFLTLALAMFDLGKTILEEEVLMHKDIFRHSSTRRTITRFIAAILIAVSIEALLMMFKAALGEGERVVEAVWMMFAAVGLLIGLGIYVNLGARAEVALLRQRERPASAPQASALEAAPPAAVVPHRRQTPHHAG